MTSLKAWAVGTLIAASAVVGASWLVFATDRYILDRSSHPARLYGLLLPGLIAVIPAVLVCRERAVRPARFWIGTLGLVLLDLSVCAVVGMPGGLPALALSTATAGTALVTAANIIGPSLGPSRPATPPVRWAAAATSAAAVVAAGVMARLLLPYGDDLDVALIINSPLLVGLASPLSIVWIRRPPGGMLACIGTIVSAQAVVFPSLTLWLLPSGAAMAIVGLVQRRNDSRALAGSVRHA